MKQYTACCCSRGDLFLLYGDTLVWGPYQEGDNETEFLAQHDGMRRVSGSTLVSITAQILRMTTNVRPFSNTPVWPEAVEFGSEWLLQLATAEKTLYQKGE